MTAATLAGAIPEGAQRRQLDALVTQVARICRSQLAAAIGNVSVVTVTAFAFDLFYRSHTGHSFLKPEKSEAFIKSIHPLSSGTIWYAFLTGIILWASSLAGGWMENFAVYRRVPLAIAEHRLGRVLGEPFMRWVSEFFLRNISGYGGSLALGFMLGMTPVLGSFFGLPLDVRHVTLSTGTLSLAIAQRGSATDPPALWAMAGIAVIFALNLATSFLLALTVALRARGIRARERWALLSAIAARFVRKPGEFLLPPGKDVPDSGGHGGHGHGGPGHGAPGR
jgi:site-specific recombinase